MDRVKQAGRWLLNLLAILIIGAGVYTVGRFLWGGIVLIAGSAHIDFGALFRATGDFLVHDTAAIWFSALATLAVWYATRNLVRVTNVQFANLGPLLMADLRLDVPVDVVSQSAYTWAAEDLGHTALRPYVDGAAVSYVYLAVGNRKTEPSTVAADVTVTVALYFGSANGQAPHPHTIRRSYRVEVLEPARYAFGPILNVGTLDAYLAVIEKVSYSDLSGRIRNAGWGRAVISKRPGMAPIYGDKIFKPRKGEFSDGHQ